MLKNFFQDVICHANALVYAMNKCSTFCHFINIVIQMCPVNLNYFLTYTYSVDGDCDGDGDGDGDGNVVVDLLIQMKTETDRAGRSSSLNRSH